MLDTATLCAFVPTRDFEKARPFYEGILGLRFVSIDAFALVLESKGVPVRVAKVQPDFTPAQFTILGWQVTDIATTATALRSHGVTFERFGFLEQDPLGIWTSPSGAKVAWFKDPDGNTLSVSQHV